MSADRATARRLVIAGMIANLAVLGYFKYFDFLISIIEQREPARARRPAGTVVHDFRPDRVSGRYLRGGRAASSFPPYAMFVSFFPHLIAGPIVRWSELGPQLADERATASTGTTSRSG